MVFLTGLRASRGVRRCALWQALALALALSLGASGSQADEAKPRVEPADPSFGPLRELAAQSPKAAHELLTSLRARLVLPRDLAQRLNYDEIDCRLLQDYDGPAAVEVARKGAEALQAAPKDITANDTRSRLAAERLEACGAGAQIALGFPKEGLARLDAVLGRVGEAAAISGARAMALIERGIYRSRHGELVTAQSDLILACRLLETPAAQASRQDVELCQWSLASHYKRTADDEEALKLIEPLLAQARARDALADVNVYAVGLAQIQARLERWDEAQKTYQQALDAAHSQGDRVGEAYAEYGLAVTLAASNQPAEAWNHAQRAAQLLPGSIDPLQLAVISNLRAKLLTSVHRPAEALALLDASHTMLEQAHREVDLSQWLFEHARAHAALGHWPQAYEDLARRAELEDRLRKQLLSAQSARIRAQYNREQDQAALRVLTERNEQSERLRRTQAVAIVLGVVVLLGVTAYAVRKFRHSRAMQQLALRDELTGLPNRRAMQRFLDLSPAAAAASEAALCVLMIDIDHFKRVNDQHGHPVGDEVLRSVAGRLAAGLRAEDRVGRFGGEEFLAVLPDTTLARALEVAERMRQAVAQHGCSTSQGELAVSVSIGVAQRLVQDADAAATLQRADEALYAAKAAGRNRVQGPSAA